MKKRKISILALFLAMALMGTACGGGGNDNDDAAPADGEAKDAKTVAISQFAEHGSLDNCREGFIQGLEESGYVEGENLTINYQNAQADTGIANQIANQFVGEKPDLVCGVATPSAQAVYNSCKDAGIPVIYTAISDPVLAGLAKEDGSGSGGVTGTSDELPLEDQVKMIRALMPDAKTIGVLYSTSEVNSISNIKRLEKICPEYDFELVTVGVNTVQDIPQATDNILEKVDCLNNLTDNTVVNSLDLVLDKAKAKDIPVFGSEIEQVKKGCVAAMNIDYVALGRETGKMAARVLDGEDIDSIEYQTIKDNTMVYNDELIKAFGFTVPEDMGAEAVA